MYTFSPTKLHDQPGSAPVRKRQFKFQRKVDTRDFKNSQQVEKLTQAPKQAVEEFDFDVKWPKELQPIMVNVDAEERLSRIERAKQSLVNVNRLNKSGFVKKAAKNNRFYSICEKVKAYILAQNFCQVVETFSQQNKSGKVNCPAGVFHRALAEWRLAQLFSFRDAQIVVLQSKEDKAQNKQLMLSDKEIAEQLNGKIAEPGPPQDNYPEQVHLLTKRDLLDLIDSKQRVALCWKELREKAVNQLAVFDSNHFCSHLQPDPVTKNQLILRFQDVTDQFLPQQIDTAICQIIEAVQLKFTQFSRSNDSHISRCIVLVVFHFQAFATGLKSSAQVMPTRVVSHSIDYRKLVYCYLQLYSSTDKRQAIYKFMLSLGLDTNLPYEGSISGVYSGLKIAKIHVQFYQVPSFYRKQHDSIPVLNKRFLPKEPDLTYEAKMMLYAISRARVQYLSSCVPLFRFKHCLFEALISSIHESELRPAQPEPEQQTFSTAHKLSRAEERNSYYQQLIHNNEILQDPITHERFLLRKYLEFMSHPPLKALLLSSIKGETVSFIECFNRLTEEECPHYCKFKISLYDINQRKFIIQAHTQLLDDQDPSGSVHSQDYGIGGNAGIQPWLGQGLHQVSSQLKEVYLVHYNGYVFGANFAKMLIIREREAKQDSQSNEDSDYSDSKSQQSENAEQDFQHREDLNQIIKVEEDQPVISSDQMTNHFNRATFEKLHFGSASDTDSYEVEKNPEVVQDLGLEIRSGFTLSAQALGMRQKKYLYREKRKNKEGSTFKNLVGLMAVKIQFAKEGDAADGEPMGIPSRLICYGSLPLRNTQMLKIFEGPTCHVKFILWALQNVTDYKVDNRTDQTMLNVFTIGGQSKELPVLLRGLVQVAGRDTHFFGDLNRVKCLWHENVKVYDLANFFETANIPVLAQTWLRANKKEVLQANSPGDKQVRDVLLTYELASKFLREIQSIQFKDSKLDFMVHQQATSASLALAIYQHFYLDPKVQIRGSLEEDILLKERKSIKSPYVLINSKTSTAAMNLESIKTIDFSKTIMRLYKMNRIMSHIHVEQPIPYMMKDFQRVAFAFDTSKHKLQHLEHKPRNCFRVKIQRSGATDADNQSNTKYSEEFQFLYSSLYKVKHLRFKSNKDHAWAYLWRVHRDAQDPSTAAESSLIIKDQYIWGVELIQGLINHSIDRLKIIEEVNYYQSRLFHNFTVEICEKRQKAQDKCQQDILEMILDNFAMRFGQKSFNIQQILHVNDLQLMTKGNRGRATEQQTSAQIQPRKLVKIIDIGYPFYYAEFKQRSTDKLQQIGSLCRITGYLNAVARVKVMHSLEDVSIQSVVYLDNQFLAVKNAALTPKTSFNNGMQAFNLTELGKWQLLLETQLQHNQDTVQPLNKSMLSQLAEILAKPINIIGEQICQKAQNLGQIYQKFKAFFTGQEETIVVQKYLTFLANRSYFSQAGETAGKIFSYEFEAQRAPSLIELESFTPQSFGLRQNSDTELDSIITLESQHDMQAEHDQAFMAQIMESESHTSQTIQRLQKAVRHFEAQFASGQMEAVVFDNINNQQDEDTDIFAAAKAHNMLMQQVFGRESLANPAYPASHPANELGNLAEFGLVMSKEDILKLPKPPVMPQQASRWKQPKAVEWSNQVINCHSPTALSSKSSNSFTSELIAQKFGLDANDPIFGCQDERKGSLISQFFSQPQKKF